MRKNLLERITDISWLRARKHDFHVEPTARTDISSLADIHKESFSRGWSDGELEKMFDNQDYLFLSVRRTGQGDQPPAGFVIARRCGDEAEVISIATRSSLRRTGAGKSTMGELIRRLSTERVKSLFLEVNETNAPAVKLYEAFGFKTVGRRKGYYPPLQNVDQPAATALVMRLELL